MWIEMLVHVRWMSAKGDWVNRGKLAWIGSASSAVYRLLIDEHPCNLLSSLLMPHEGFCYQAYNHSASARRSAAIKYPWWASFCCCYTAWSGVDKNGLSFERNCKAQIAGNAVIFFWWYTDVTQIQYSVETKATDYNVWACREQKSKLALDCGHVWYMYLLLCVVLHMYCTFHWWQFLVQRNVWRLRFITALLLTWGPVWDETLRHWHKNRFMLHTKR